MPRSSLGREYIDQLKITDEEPSAAALQEGISEFNNSRGYPARNLVYRRGKGNREFISCSRYSLCSSLSTTGCSLH